MNSIVKASEKDFKLLTDIGRLSFMESHGNAGKTTDINIYLNKNYNHDSFKAELSDPENIYYIIYHDKKLAGYSKILFNIPHSHIQEKNVTKLERLYLLEEFYGLGLGFELFEFNLELSKQQKQAGMWLFVWKGNPRAVRFYEKAGFKVIGSYDFKISETHSNPNHQMYLKY